MASGGTKNNRYRIVLMGKTGTGKSSLGNSILGSPEFVAKASVNAVTRKCSTKEGKLSNLDIEVIDTPGLIDTHDKDGEVESLIAEALVQMLPGPHVVLMVVKGGDRFTHEEYEAYTRVKRLLESKDETKPMAQHMIVVFTGGDKLDESKTVMEDEIENGPPQLKKMLGEVDNRYIVIDNKADVDKNQKQMCKLQEMITKVAPTEGDYFNSDILREIDYEVKKRTSVTSESAAKKVVITNIKKKNVICIIL